MNAESAKQNLIAYLADCHVRTNGSQKRLASPLLAMTEVFYLRLSAFIRGYFFRGITKSNGYGANTSGLPSGRM